MTTHNQEILNKLNRRVIKLDHGRVVSDQVGGSISDDDDSDSDAEEGSVAYKRSRKVGGV